MVLILVVVDNGLVHCGININRFVYVLILVAVDNGLVLSLIGLEKMLKADVLILAVVDNGLVLSLKHLIRPNLTGLNPCCSGQWSRTEPEKLKDAVKEGLNPCCSGQWSRTNYERF